MSVRIIGEILDGRIDAEIIGINENGNGGNENSNGGNENGNGGNRSGDERKKHRAITKAINVIGDTTAACINFAAKIDTLNTQLDIFSIELTKLSNKFINESAKINFETAFSNQLASMETYMKETINLTNASFKMLSDGVNKGAYAAYTATLNYNFEKERLDRQIALNEEKRSINLFKLKSQNKVEIQKTEMDIDLKEAEKRKTAQNFAAGQVQRLPTSNIYVAAAKNAAKIASAAAEKHYQDLSNTMNKEKAVMGMELENLTGQIDNYSLILQKQNEVDVKTLENKTNLLKMYAEQAQQVEGWIIDFNKHATNMVRQYGYIGGQLSGEIGKNTVGGLTSWAIGAKIGLDDIAKSQSEYQRTTGRNLRFNEKDVNEISFLDKYIGESGYTGNISAQLQTFNKSISDSTTMIAKRMASVERSGLSGRKYAKDIEKYIGMANKYNFKGGTEGLAKMVEYAQKTKFNMDSLGGALDKFSSNDISSVLESAAKLNVLGGNAALYSDPIGMMYDAVNDPESFAKRLQAMASEHGTFNKDTGEMIYFGAGNRIMTELSSITGVAIEDMKKMNNEAEKRRQITKVMSGKGFSDDSLDFLIANSFWDKESQKWMANNGKESVAIDKLDDGDLKGLMPVTTEAQIEDITKNIRSISTYLNPFLTYDEKDNLAKQAGQLKISEALFGLFDGEFKKRLENMGISVDKMLQDKEHMDGLATAIIGTTDAIPNIFTKLNEVDKLNSINSHLGNIETDTNLLTKDIKKEMAHDKGEEDVKALFDSIFMTGPKTMGQQRAADDYRKWQRNGYDLTGFKVTGVKTDEYGNYIESYFSPIYKKSLKDKYRFKTDTDYSYEHFVRAHDGISSGSMISSTGLMITDPKDVNMSWMKGGPLDTLFNGVVGKVNVIGDFVEKNIGKGGSTGSVEHKSMNVNVTFGGKAELACNGNQVNLATLITSDPFAMRKISEMVLTEISKYNDGRGAVNAYTNVGKIFA